MDGEEKKKAADQAWQDNFDMAAYERERAERRRLRDAEMFDDNRLLKMETKLGLWAWDYMDLLFTMLNKRI